MTIMEGDGVVIKVLVTGDPEPLIKWYYEGAELMSNISREILSNGSLVISSSAQRHSGIYKMTADNTHGSAEKIIQLFIVANKSTKIGVEEEGAVPVHLQQFGEYVSDHHAKSNRGFKVQYRVCQSVLTV